MNRKERRRNKRPFRSIPAVDQERKLRTLTEQIHVTKVRTISNQGHSTISRYRVPIHRIIYVVASLSFPHRRQRCNAVAVCDFSTHKPEVSTKVTGTLICSSISSYWRRWSRYGIGGSKQLRPDLKPAVVQSTAMGFYTTKKPV
jgi:hypothetical protein